MRIKLLLLILLIPFLLISQEYTLDKLIEIGLEKSYDIQQENAAYKNYKSYLRSSWFGLLPTASIKASTTNQESSDMERVWTKSAGFTLSKNLSLNESSYYNIWTSILSARNSGLSLEGMRKEIAFYVFSQYLYILEAQKNLDIQFDNLELQQRIYDQVQVQYTSGEKALLDLKQSEISLIDYEIAVNEAENGLIQQRQDLFTYLNIPDEGYDFIEPEFDISEEEFVYQENYTLLRKRNSIKSSKVSLFQQKVDFLPSLTFSFSYQNTSLSDEIDDFSAYDDSYTMSLAASFDIFDLFEKRESFVRSRRNLEIEELDLENSEQELRSELSNLINDMKTLRRSRDLYFDKLNLAEENLSMAQEQFRLGIISLLDLDRTKIEYQNAQLSYNNRYYELIRKQEEINKTLSRNILNRW